MARPFVVNFLTVDTCSRAGCTRPLRYKRHRLCHPCYEWLRRRGQLAVRSRDPVERFWSHVDRSGSCWVWTATTGTHGYGRVFWLGKQRQAHRIAYELIVGPIPEGLELDHLCRNRACVRPNHLEPVQQAENLRRGYSPLAINGRKTHCPKGHEYTPDNTRPTKLGRRCRTCDRERNARRSAQEKAARSLAVKSTNCSICGTCFEYIGYRRSLCSDACRLESGRRSAREHQRRKRASA